MILKIPEEYREMPEISEITRHPAFYSMRKFRHHGNMSCLEHTLKVTERAFIMAVDSEADADVVSTIRGALLHDFYLYDWHGGGPSWHGLRHPRLAYKEASTLFDINPVERDAIIKHMFPLTPIPPRHRESWIVCIADKISAFEDYSGQFSRYIKSWFKPAVN